MSAAIPMSGDVAELIGANAEKVENRSLLLDKFIFHKGWGSDGIKRDSAHRWSLLRVTEGGPEELSREAQEADKTSRRDINPEKAARLSVEARLAENLASSVRPSGDLSSLRQTHTRRFLGLFRSAYGDRASITIGQLEGRLAINLANGIIPNAGICLDRLFGLPYIPGSAVKGVCRHTALEELKTAKETEKQRELFELFRLVFGTADNDFEKGDLKAFHHLLRDRPENQKGAVSFLPAYPVNEARIVVDLTNVHYPDYYRTGRTKYLPKESPQPNPFPAVETGAQFAFCLVLHDPKSDAALLKAAGRWLEIALTERGLGAKTAAGYGWFSLCPKVLEQIEAELRKEKEEAERLASLSPDERVEDAIRKLEDEAFATFAKTLAEKPEIEQRAFFRVLESKDKREKWRTWKKRKPDLVKIFEEVRKQLGLPPLT